MMEKINLIWSTNKCFNTLYYVQSLNNFQNHGILNKIYELNSRVFTVFLTNSKNNKTFLYAGKYYKNIKR